MARLSVKSIVTQAYKDADITGLGDYLSDLELDEGLHKLQNIIDELNAMELWVPSRTTLVYSPKVQKSIYTIGKLIGNASLAQSQMYNGYAIDITNWHMSNEAGIVNVLYDNGNKLPNKQVFNDRYVINNFIPDDNDVALSAIAVNIAGVTTLTVTLASAVVDINIGDNFIYSDGENYGYALTVSNVLSPNTIEFDVNSALSLSRPAPSIDTTWNEIDGTIFRTQNVVNPIDEYGVVWTSDDDFDTLPNIITDVATPDYIKSLKYDNRGGFLEPVKQVSDDDWDVSSIQMISPTLPCRFRYQWDYPYGQIEFDRALLDLYDLHIEILKTVPELVDVNEMLYLKAGYSGYLETALAAEVMNQSQDNSKLRALASRKLQVLRRANTQPKANVQIPSITGKAMFYDYRSGTVVPRRGR